MDRSERASQAVRKTPLHDRHAALGAKIAPFAGYLMPIHYRTGQIEEHRAVRTRAGLFDVSHMGEFDITGPGAAALLDRLTPSRISALEPGRARYTAFTTDTGGFVDDILVYRVGEERFLVVVNAANRNKDRDWVESRLDGHRAEFSDRSDDYALLALQGPESREILAPLASGFDARALRSYRVAEGRVAGRPALVSRTGYTGEIGFEIFLDPGDAGAVWDALLESGSDRGLLPAGLGARDTLRLEAALPLYGHDIDESTNVLEAGLEFIVDWDKDDFVGKSALLDARSGPLAKRRIGFAVEGRGIARAGQEIYWEGRSAGNVTSGSWSPTLERAIGMGYLPPAAAEPGTGIEIDIRGRRVGARVVELPFYRRPRRRRT
ncbi:MAG: glycine cleavage system aminomethyltransferase GcvT [Acidobacteria bacterium]|nr:MAG: glycine cleavage system aminomethyltransferase GcvT [Acidobacteriota bacterium]